MQARLPIIRGHGDETESNFIQLLKLRSEDDPRVEAWLKKKTDKYTTFDIQNEIIKIIAMKVLHNLIAPIQAATFICIMADETTDAANKEQVVVCLRWVDNVLEPTKTSLAYTRYRVNEASAVLAVIRDVFKRLDIPIAKLRGQCYDGASAMSGSISRCCKADT